jgi:hypothetical protein
MDARVFQKPPDFGLHGGHVIQGCMAVPRKGDVFVKKIGFDHGKQVPATHGFQFFSGGEPAVVAHDAAHKTGAQEHVRALHQNHGCSQFYGAECCGTSGPSAADNNDPHMFVSVWIICVRVKDLLF